MTEYFHIIWNNLWNNKLYYGVGILILSGTFFLKWLLKKIFKQKQDTYFIRQYSQLEQNIKDWAFYRYILYYFISPQSIVDLEKTEIGAISELNDILIDLKEWGGLNYSDGVWLITEKGKKILEKHSKKK